MGLELITLTANSFDELKSLMEKRLKSMAEYGYELKSHSHSESRANSSYDYPFKAIMIFEKKDKWKISN